MIPILYRPPNPLPHPLAVPNSLPPVADRDDNLLSAAQAVLSTTKNQKLTPLLHWNSIPRLQLRLCLSTSYYFVARVSQPSLQAWYSPSKSNYPSLSKGKIHIKYHEKIFSIFRLPAMFNINKNIILYRKR